MEIANLNIDQLVKLRGEVETRLQTLVSARQDELKAESERLSSINGKTVLKPSKKVKYKDGQNEWAGTGATPSWLKSKQALGESIEKYRVKEGA